MRSWLLLIVNINFIDDMRNLYLCRIILFFVSPHRVSPNWFNRRSEKNVLLHAPLGLPHILSFTELFRNTPPLFLHAPVCLAVSLSLFTRVSWVISVSPSKFIWTLDKVIHTTLAIDTYLIDRVVTRRKIRGSLSSKSRCFACIRR